MDLTRTRAAARALLAADADLRNAALAAVEQSLAAHREAVLAANVSDVLAARDGGLSMAMLDRLALDPARYDAMIAAVREVRALPDPLGEERTPWFRPNGLRITKRRIPLGVIAVVYEARPNVTVEASSLALKSGNAVVLRGGRDAMASNRALAAAVRAGLEKVGLPPDAVTFVDDPSRERVVELLGAVGLVDLVIPRGGADLMKLVDEHARVPVIRHGQGICQVYVDAGAEPEMAEEIVFNAKVHRPGVCNAAETLLVHSEHLANGTLARIARKLADEGCVELRADEASGAALSAAGIRHSAATDRDWDTEFLSLVMAVRVVPSLDAALDHIAAHGTHHTASIVTPDADRAAKFLREVDASCVLWNASTRFNDGSELGLGAEIGISTSKMHAFGPMGLRELTAEKFVVIGDGQVRA
ncbi:MAG: glutamate-5-semialdehyde dehydrogenase [Deltaproteobacteria bacterium]